MTPSFDIDMSVRDYELDLQGIVNNATYLNYFEHARHMCLQRLGFDFARMHESGVEPVVSEINVRYRRSLRSGDLFTVKTSITRDGVLRFVFDQHIVVQPHGEVAAEALVTAVFLSNGRPSRPPAAVVEAIGG